MDFLSQPMLPEDDLLELLGIEEERPRGRVKTTQEAVQKTFEHARPLEIVPESEFDELEALTTSRGFESKQSSTTLSKQFEQEGQGPFGLLPTSQYAHNNQQEEYGGSSKKSSISQAIGHIEAQIAMRERDVRFETLKDVEDRAKRYGHYRVQTIILYIFSVELVNDVVLLELSDGVKTIKASLSARYVETKPDGGDNSSFLWDRLGIGSSKGYGMSPELQQYLTNYPLLRGRQVIQLKGGSNLQERRLLRIENAPLIWFEANESATLVLVDSNIKHVHDAPN